MGELVKKVKIDAGDYQRGTDETGKRLKFISATQTCQRCAEPEPSPRPHASRRLAPALTKALSRSPPPSLPRLRPVAHPRALTSPPLAKQHEDSRAGPVRV